MTSVVDELTQDSGQMATRDIIALVIISSRNTLTPAFIKPFLEPMLTFNR